MYKDNVVNPLLAAPPNEYLFDNNKIKLIIKGNAIENIDKK